MTDAEDRRRSSATVPRHRAPDTLPGAFQATAAAGSRIAAIEAQVTAWYAGQDVSWTDVLDWALSIAGLTITVDSMHNRATIQSI